MSIKEKLPLINSNSKGTRIAGYAIYGFIFLLLIGAILPSENESIGNSGNESDAPLSADAESTTSSHAELFHSGFGNYTYDDQSNVKAIVKKGTDPIHMMDMSELPTDFGYTRDSAQYTITSTGKRLKGYIDYSDDGYVVVLQPRLSSLTKGEFKDILDTFRRIR